jgi:hypothetical protein
MYQLTLKLYIQHSSIQNTLLLIYYIVGFLVRYLAVRYTYLAVHNVCGFCLPTFLGLKSNVYSFWMQPFLISCAEDRLRRPNSVTMFEILQPLCAYL